MDTTPQAQLKTLNQLLGAVADSDPFLVEQIQRSIHFTLEGAEGGGPDCETLARAAEQVLALHAQDKGGELIFYHCQLKGQYFDPLWVRDDVLKGLRWLAGCRVGVLVITGLRRVICPPHAYWTERRAQEYADAMACIEDMASRHSSPRSRLHLLFL